MINMLQGMLRDLVHAGRALARARSFTVVCVVSLGIGMAPVIAVPYGTRVFSLPPPLVNADGLVEILTTRQGPREPSDVWSYPDFVDLRGANTGIAMVGWATGQSELSGHTSGTRTDTVGTMFVSADYFQTIGVPLARGAGFSAGGSEPVVIVGHDFWTNRLAADPGILGKPLVLDGTPHVVAGVAPEGFDGHLLLDGRDLFVLLEEHPNLRTGGKVRGGQAEDWVRIHGRLLPGVSVAQASAAVDALSAQLAGQYPATNEFKAGVVEPYDAIGNLARAQLVILRMVGLTLTGLILLVVCLNISGMMLVRSAMRERELSIRQSIGATRGRLMRYLLAESIVLAALGATLASVVLFNAPSVIAWVSGEPLPLQLERALRIDVSIIAICAALCLLASLVFGWLPAARFSRPVIISSLKDEAGAGGLRVGRVHRVTAALQVAISVPLLVMGGISLDRVRSTATSDLGFASDLLYAAPLLLSSGADSEFQIRRAREHLAGATGVAAVTVADGLPLDFRYRIRRVALTTSANEAPRFMSVHVTRVGEGYLETMRIPLVRGRGFTDERAGGELVTIVSATLAGQLLPDADPGAVVGQRLRYGADEKTQRTLTIVGVTDDFPTSQMSTERAQLLLPLSQHPDLRRDSAPIGSDIDESPRLMIVARSEPGAQPGMLTAALENVARELDPEFTRAGVVTGVWLRENSMRDFLTQSAVAGVTGGIILTLSALGIYGVVGLMVTTRTRELAVRTALGASRRRVVGMILLDVVKLVTPGVVVGMLLAAVLIRLNAENMGVSLSTVENITYPAGAAVAILVAVIASVAPARRAASVPPMIAMRSL
jgi:putative ABC transport system permease protein